MHKECWDFLLEVKSRFPRYFIGNTVIEVGSRDLNGSPRQLFIDCQYTGYDFMAGNGVDVVARFSGATPLVDVVVSTEALEHDRDWKQTVYYMIASLKQDGLLIITAASPDRPWHSDRLPGDIEGENEHYAGIPLLALLDEVDCHLRFIYCEDDKAHGDIRLTGIRK